MVEETIKTFLLSELMDILDLESPWKEDHVVGKKKQGDQDMVEETINTFLLSELMDILDLESPWKIYRGMYISLRCKIKFLGIYDVVFFVALPNQAT
jgi:hypothetical protein